jgi:hypothetical protein
MRKINVVKQAWFGRPSREVSQDPRHPGDRTLPVKLHVLASIVRDRHARPAMQHRLAHCRHRSRVVHVGAQVPTMIDATEHPLRIGNKLEQSDPRAIRRGAINGKSLLPTRFDPQETVRCDRMADAGLWTRRRDNDRIADLACCAQQCFQTGRIDPVIIAKKELHGKQLDGHKRLSFSSRLFYFSANI